MEGSIIYKNRYLDTSESSGFDDLCGYIQSGDKVRHALSCNPSLKGDKSFQVLACDANKVIGSGFHFPTTLIINGQKVQSLSCSTLSVSNDYRKRGIGSTIHGIRMEHSESGSIYIGSISRMQYTIMERLGAKVFFTPRLLKIKHSRPVLNLILPKQIAICFAALVDLFLMLYSGFLCVVARFFGKSRYSFDKVNIADETFDNIFNSDTHSYKECHDSKWMNWMLECNKDVSLYYIKSNGNTVGYVVLKDTHYEEATRGLRDVTIRSIVEWESIDNKLRNFKLCLFASLLKGKYDVLELCTFDKSNTKKFRILGFLSMGLGNSVLRLSEMSYLRECEGITDAKYWRLRPAAGDNILF